MAICHPALQPYDSRSEPISAPPGAKGNYPPITQSDDSPPANNPRNGRNLRLAPNSDLSRQHPLAQTYGVAVRVIPRQAREFGGDRHCTRAPGTEAIV